MNVLLQMPVTAQVNVSSPSRQTMKHMMAAIQQLSSARNLETVMAIVRVVARKLMSADGSCIVLREQDYCFYVDESAIAPLWKGQRFPMQSCISGWAMKHRQTCTIADIYRDARIPLDVYRSTFVKSLAMVPIQVEEPIGAIGVYWAKQQQPSAEAIEMLQTLASATALALENVRIYAELELRVRRRTAELEYTTEKLRMEVAQRQAAAAELHKLSMTDELTGLYNRRGFLCTAEQQLKSVQRGNASVCLFFIDLDGLKQVNDSYGHEVGDCLLTAAGQVLQKTFRESDVVARLGGDGFAVLVPNCTETDGVLERLQTNISRFNQVCSASYRLAMSVGATMCRVNNEVSLEQMITQADSLMYAQKQRKRLQR